MNTADRFWALFNNMAELILGLGTVIFVTRHFSVAESGLWFVFIAIFGLASAMRDALVQAALARGIITEASSGEATKTNLLLTLGTEVLISSLVTIFGFLSDAELSTLLLGYSLYAIPNALLRWHIFYLRSVFLIRRVALASMVNAAVSVAGMVVLIWANGPLDSMLWVLGAGSFCGAAVATSRIPWKEILSARWSLQSLASIWSMGKYALMREAVSAVSSRIGLMFSTSYLSLHHTAWLGVSQRFAQVALLPNNAFQSLLFPAVMTQTRDGQMAEARRTVYDAMSTLLALTIPAALAGCLLSPYLLEWVSGSSYRGAAGLLTIYVAVAVLITPFGALMGTLATALGKPSIAFRLVMVNGIIHVLLAWFLMSQFGLWGAPLAMVITEVAGLVVVNVIVARVAGIRLVHVVQEVPQVYKRIFNKINNSRIAFHGK